MGFTRVKNVEIGSIGTLTAVDTKQEGRRKGAANDSDFFKLNIVHDTSTDIFQLLTVVRRIWFTAMHDGINTKRAGKRGPSV